MAMTRAQKMRAERQEALREYLSSRGLVEYVIDLAEKIEEPGSDVQSLKASADIRMKLINKYLPDMKFVEGDLSHAAEIEVTKIERVITDPSNTNS
tara:strand:+ start:9191 stop:9478 length:288 start_codon:yes stop_codon:yes gene_type:complete